MNEDNMNEINLEPTIVKMDEKIESIDVPIDITHVKSVRCYNFGKCMKTCCRIDKNLNDKKDFKCTPLMMTEGTACGSALGGTGFAVIGCAVACCDSCTRGTTTTAPYMWGQFTCWQTSLIISASCFALTLLSLTCCGSIYLCNKCGTKCTYKLGCHSFSKGFEAE